MKINYILPKAVKPIKYSLTLVPNLDKSTFSGEESINLEIIKETDVITLNSRDLDITSVSLEQDKVIKSRSISYNENNQTISIIFDEKIKRGNAVLKIGFSGRLSSSMRGFYRSSYIGDKGDKKLMATTQFESVDARSCFPCFDEPELKSVFFVTLIIK